MHLRKNKGMTFLSGRDLTKSPLRWEQEIYNGRVGGRCHVTPLLVCTSWVGFVIRGRV